MASFAAALFFLRYWRQTHDTFFLLFAMSFALDAASLHRHAPGAYDDCCP